MQTGYTDEDTARAREAQHGGPAHPAAPIAASLPAPAARSGGNTLAIALIVMGLFLGARQLDLFYFPSPFSNLSSGNLEGAMFFFTISSIFLFFALWRHIYGLLIPGCIIAGFGLGVMFSGLAGGAGFFWGLGAGFLAILLAGRALLGVHRDWPIYPAAGLFGFGMVIATTTSSAFFWLPLALIGAGLLLGARRLRP